MTTMFKHLQPQDMPSTALVPGGFPIAPAMQAIIVDRIPVVNPQFASVIGNNAETVMACVKNSVTTCPTYSKVITTAKTMPITTCVPVIYIMPPALHVGPAAV
jgi:hypothetical protein